MLARGFFVTLEGGEGAGKSTLARGLKAKAEVMDIVVRLTREPGGTKAAEAIRDLALHAPDNSPLSPTTQALLMNAARADHFEKVIQPALSLGEIVICDRFADSTRVYQGTCGGVPSSNLSALEHVSFKDKVPQLTFILDACPKDLIARRQARDSGEPLDAFEARDLAFHQAVREGFLDIAKQESERCVVLNALESEDVLAAQAWALICKKANLPR